MPQQDFVLFDSPNQPISHHQHSRQFQQQSVSAIPGSVLTQQVPHSQLQNLLPSSLQNRFCHRIQSTISDSPVSTAPAIPRPHRFSCPAAQSHFYASSAPSSAVALNNSNKLHLVSQQLTSARIRPPVPPFPGNPPHHNSTGSIPQISGNMVLEDLHDLSMSAALDSVAFTSPALGVFDPTASVSSNSSHVGTVSPNDLLLQDPYLSAPNSTALTTLTSPSDYNESPYSDFNVSPNFAPGDIDMMPDGMWYPPLFPAAAAVGDASVPSSDAVVDVSDLSPDRKESGSRHKSSHGHSHSRTPSTATKHSSSAGVNSRRREKPLAPIVVDDLNDCVAMKRARNTLAARKSRARKQERLDELEEAIAKLTEERDHWKKMALEKTKFA